MPTSEGPLGIFDTAFLCDAASEYGGRLSALGAFINTIHVGSLPGLAQISLVLRLSWLMGDETRFSNYQTRVEVRTPRGRQIQETVLSIEGEMAGTEEAADLPVAANLILPLVIPLEELGVHQVVISIENTEVKTIPFKVLVGPPQT
jgi:hypothetical protein